MIEKDKVFEEIYKGLENVTGTVGLKAEFPEGIKQNEVPVEVDGDVYKMKYTGENGNAVIVWNSGRSEIALNCSDSPDAAESDYRQVSLWLLDSSDNDEKDLKSVINDFEESIGAKYGQPQPTAAKDGKVKMPQVVPKSAAKSGILSYDPNTLATRLAVIYPDFKEPIKDNMTKNGEFLPEDFFKNYAAPRVLEVIKSGDKQKTKKLFNLLNEIYEDGTNEVQDIIIVTILGGMNNDPDMMAVADEYMSDFMKPEVHSVNKLLASSGGKKLREKLDNPPEYKPKKKKESNGGFMNMLGM